MYARKQIPFHQVEFVPLSESSSPCEAEIILSGDRGGIPYTYCQLTGCASQLASGRPFGCLQVLSFKQRKLITTESVAEEVGSLQNHYEG